jgi:hypothetical protein
MVSFKNLSSMAGFATVTSVFLTKALIRGLWSNQMCIFVKRMNKHPISDKKINMYERCSTFEGPEMYSESCNFNVLIVYYSV